MKKLLFTYRLLKNASFWQGFYSQKIIDAFKFKEPAMAETYNSNYSYYKGRQEGLQLALILAGVNVTRLNKFIKTHKNKGIKQAVLIGVSL